MRALRISLEKDLTIKENLSKNFELFYIKEYSKVICGEDWYIAIKNDGTIEEVVLPLNNSKTLEEIERVKEIIFSDKLSRKI